MTLHLKLPHLHHFGYNKNFHFKCKTVTIKHRNVLDALSSTSVVSVAGIVCQQKLMITKVFICAWDQFLGGAGSGGVNRFFFFFFSDFSSLWAFQRYKTPPYLMSTYFWSIQGPQAIFGWGRKLLGQVNFFDFLESPPMGFPMIYDMTILNKHPFLVIFGQVSKWVLRPSSRAGSPGMFRKNSDITKQLARFIGSIMFTICFKKLSSQFVILTFHTQRNS